MDLARTDAQRQMLTLVFADQEMGRPLAGPPEMPPERLAVWRRAFEATMKDPEFLAESAALHLDVDGPIDGPAVEEVVRRLYETPAAIAEEVRAIREE
jgi:tripartite-type tricarboxylate transporter receptor subunit TctC